MIVESGLVNVVITADGSNLRLSVPRVETFWAFQYPDLPKNQAEVNNHLVGDHGFDFGDRVEFDEIEELLDS